MHLSVVNPKLDNFKWKSRYLHSKNTHATAESPCKTAWPRLRVGPHMVLTRGAGQVNLLNNTGIYINNCGCPFVRSSVRPSVRSFVRNTLHYKYACFEYKRSKRIFINWNLKKEVPQLNSPSNFSWENIFLNENCKRGTQPKAP